MTTEKPTTFTCEQCGQVKERKSMKGPVPKRCEDCKAKNKDAATTERVNKLRAEQGRELIPTDEPLVPAGAGVEVAVKDAPEDDTLEEELAEVEFEPPAETTWLDSDEAQELLRQKRQREVDTGVTYDAEVHGSVQDFLARAAESFEGLTDEPETQAALDDPGPRIPEVDHLGHTDEDYATSTERVNALRDKHRPVDLASPAAVCAADACGSPDPPHAGLFCANHWQQISLEDRNVLLGSPVNSEPFVQTARRAIIKLRP